MPNIVHVVETDKWVMTRKPGHTSKSNTGSQQASASSRRLTASFQYVGD